MGESCYWVSDFTPACVRGNAVIFPGSKNYICQLIIRQSSRQFTLGNILVTRMLGYVFNTTISLMEED